MAKGSSSFFSLLLFYTASLHWWQLLLTIGTRRLRFILINTMSTNSTIGTEPGFLDQTGALSLLSSLCEKETLRILPEYSHFFNELEVPQNQRFHNGAYIWEGDNDTAISPSSAIANVTMLGSGRSGLFQISRQPFHPKVVREFTVGLPEEKDPFAISRLYIMEEGIYTVRTESYGETGDTRVSRKARAAKGETPSKSGVDMWLPSAKEAFGENAEKGDWTMGTVDFYRFKEAE